MLCSQRALGWTQQLPSSSSGVELSLLGDLVMITTLKQPGGSVSVSGSQGEAGAAQAKASPAWTSKSLLEAVGRNLETRGGGGWPSEDHGSPQLPFSERIPA